MENSTTQDRRARRSQKALTDAMMALLAEKPLQEIAVQEITEAADVNRSTFYAHYADKYDLFEATIRRMFQRDLEEKLPAPQNFCGETLKYLIVVTCEFFGQFPRTCSPKYKQLDAMIESQVQIVLYEYLLEWLQSTGFETGEAAQTRAMLMSWTIFGTGVEYRNRPDGKTPEQFATTVFDLLSQRVIPKPENWEAQAWHS